MILRIVHPRTFIYDCPKKAKGMLRTFRSILWNCFYYFTVGDMFVFLESYQSLLKYLNKNIFKLKSENLFFFKAESSSGFNLETINDSRLDADQLLDRKGVNIWMKIILFINFNSFQHFFKCQLYTFH